MSNKVVDFSVSVYCYPGCFHHVKLKTTTHVKSVMLSGDMIKSLYQQFGKEVHDHFQNCPNGNVKEIIKFHGLE